MSVENPLCIGGAIEIVIPIRLAEKRIYHDCRTDESSDSDDRTRSSRPTVNISASLCSYQSRSQSVAWSHDTSSRNKIRQRSSFELGRHTWCQSWVLLGRNCNQHISDPLLPPSSAESSGSRRTMSQGVLQFLPTQFRGREHTLAGWDLMAPVMILSNWYAQVRPRRGLLHRLPNRLAPSLYLAHDKTRHAERNCRTDNHGEYKKVPVLQQQH
jgi:hypothetical protein